LGGIKDAIKRQMSSVQKGQKKTPPETALTPLIFGAYSNKNKIYFFSSQTKNKKIIFGESFNTEDFQITKSTLTIRGFQSIHISKFNGENIAILRLKTGGLRIAMSKDMRTWQNLCQLKGSKYPSGVIPSEFKPDGDYLMYLGGQSIRIATSQNGKKWKIDTHQLPILPVKKNELIEVDLAVKIPKGILLCYRLIRQQGDYLEHKVHLALFDLTFPEHLIWRSYLPIWEDRSKLDISYTVNTLFFRSQLISFWSHADRGIELIHYPVVGLNHNQPKVKISNSKEILENTHDLKQNKFRWQSCINFDPTALLEDGNIHTLYRLEHILGASQKPEPDNLIKQLTDILSNGSLWRRPVLISPANIFDKNVIIFPEKINRKYVIMHNSFPNIAIDYVPDLNFDGSHWLRDQDLITPRTDMWDSFNISTGAAPIKTKEGWLLIYNCFENSGSKFYRIGAMLLDLENPSQILFRTSQPIFIAEKWNQILEFELCLAYATGALLLDQKIVLYYRNGNRVVNFASTELKTFLGALNPAQEANLQYSK
jgi:predicted GH43/DUF377 family glycosyl hydrolase